MERSAQERRFERERQRLAGALKSMLQEQRGADFLQRFRDVGRLTSGLRSRFQRQEQIRLRRRLASTAVPELVEIARALTLSFWLLNLCEERNLIRSHAAGERGRLATLFEHLRRRGVPKRLVEAALRDLRVTIVLTAHPTEAVRWSIHESLERIGALLDAPGGDGDDDLLRELTALWQTEILRHRAPEPLDEVRHVAHTMEHVLAPSMVAVLERLAAAFANAYGEDGPAGLKPLQLASWVGGDRDGNPFVTADVTRSALTLYRQAILERYLAEVPHLIRELAISAQRVAVTRALRTSLKSDLAALPLVNQRVKGRNPKEVYRLKLNAIAVRLELSKAEAQAGERAGARGGYRAAEQLLAELHLIEESLIRGGGQRLAAGRLRRLGEMVEIFGLQLAVLDVRQHRGRHREARKELIVPAEGPIESLPLDRQQVFLESLILSDALPAPALSADAAEVVATLRGVREAQERFGPNCVQDLVISDTGSEIPVLELLLLARHAGLVTLRENGGLTSYVNLVPLFESIDALESAACSMERLYGSQAYRAHLASRGMRQQIMLGYSDSVKGGGYLAASFCLYRAQRELAAQGQRHGIHIEFFHGRGGTVARGGGPAHQAILAQPVGSVMGRIKLTEQGEVISHKYDSVPSAIYHLEQTLSAALEASLPLGALPGRGPVPAVWEEIMAELSELSRTEYRSLVYDAPSFVEAFYAMTPIEEISELRIGSRPAKRAASRRVEDLRAIPWTFAWNQSRVLLPAWYGAGTALGTMLRGSRTRRADMLGKLRRMYRRWPFFRSVIDNLQQVLAKTDLEIAALYAALATTQEAAEVLKRIRREYARTVRAVLAIAARSYLLAGHDELAKSLALRGPDLDALGYIQVELLKRKRRGSAPRESPALTQAIQLTINGVAAGLRNTG